MPLLRSEVHPLLQLVHHLTQLHTRHARLHAQLLHARLHAMLLHDERLHSELLQPVHRLHVRRSSQLLDAIRNGTATPTSDGDPCRSTRRLSDATNPVFLAPAFFSLMSPFTASAATDVRRRGSLYTGKSSFTLYDAHRPRYLSQHLYTSGRLRRLRHPHVLHALAATPSTCSTLFELRLRCAPRSSSYLSVYPVHSAAYSRRATLFDFTSPPDVRLRS
ncbi:hypothetical protein AAVH_25683 [Aphelenchoides avenae]|nr:hypothetical protein AAVH_25683 [Aphelenchus avenae]